MLLRFFISTFVVAWLFFITANWTSDNGQLSGLLVFFGAISPGVVAILLTAITSGGSGVKELLNKISLKNTAVKWYVFAIVFIPIIKGLAALVFYVGYQSWPQFGTASWYSMLVAIALSMWVQAGEEIGWRGFAFPRLSERFGLAFSSILLGIIWAAWHLPLFYLSAADTFNRSFPLYVLQTTGLSVIMAWLFWKVRGNVLPLMVFHAAFNNTKDIVPSSSPASSSPFTFNASPIGWISLALLWLFAFYALYAMTRKPQATIP